MGCEAVITTPILVICKLLPLTLKKVPPSINHIPKHRCSDREYLAIAGREALISIRGRMGRGLLEVVIPGSLGTCSKNENNDYANEKVVKPSSKKQLAAPWKAVSLGTLHLGLRVSQGSVISSTMNRLHDDYNHGNTAY